jgi:hypothetical protein
MKCLTIYIESAMHFEKIVLNIFVMRIFSLDSVAWNSSQQKSGAHIYQLFSSPVNDNYKLN